MAGSNWPPRPPRRPRGSGGPVPLDDAELFVTDAAAEPLAEPASATEPAPAPVPAAKPGGPRPQRARSGPAATPRPRPTPMAGVRRQAYPTGRPTSDRTLAPAPARTPAPAPARTVPPGRPWSLATGPAVAVAPDPAAVVPDPAAGAAPDPTPPSAPSRWRRRLVVLPLAIPLVVHAVGAWQRRWLQEDGFINIRVAQQVVAGHGPVYNVGERVEAFTSPLWLGLLVALRALTFGQVSYEWLSVGAGLALALAGTIGLLVGATTLWTPLERRPGDSWWLPVGALVLVSLSATWDFSSSGLETGLALAWIGWSFALVARVGRAATRQERDRARGRAARRGVGLRDVDAANERVSLYPALALVGLGPLVRPELVLYSAGFAVAIVVAGWRPVRHLPQAPARWRMLVAFLAVPLAYQLFRMGYYAAVVPNTALAKNAARSSWPRGVDYLENFLGPYRLLLLAGPYAVALGLALRGFRRDQRVLVAALVVPALLQGLYVVWIGGDYMHGRFWVVPLAALLAPLAAVPIPRGWLGQGGRAGSIVRLAGAGGVAVFAVAAIGWLRPPQQAGSVVDQREVIVAIARSEHPVLLSEQPAPFPAFGDALRVSAGDDVYLDTDEGRLLAWAGDASEASVAAKGPGVIGQTTTAYPRERGGLVIRYDGLGMVGVAAGLDVEIIDNFGLADPVASRLPTAGGYAAGHTRQLPVPWRRARVGLPGADAPGSVEAAEALGCGALADYLEDIHEEMTPGQFVSNLFSAPANTMLRIPGDPVQARDRFC